MQWVEPLVLLVLAVAVALPLAFATDPEGLDFLARNRQDPHVVELASGLQYKILVNGTGSFHPTPMCQCLVDYEGRLLNGHVFDSSIARDEPLRVSASQVIDGWAEAMHLMVKEDKWELYIPSELGYGELGYQPDIPGHALLIFTLEMLGLACPPEQQMPALNCDIATGAQCSGREWAYVQKTASWTADKISGELTRLSSMMAEGTPQKQDLLE